MTINRPFSAPPTWHGGTAKSMVRLGLKDVEVPAVLLGGATEALLDSDE